MTNYKLKTDWAGFKAGEVKTGSEWSAIIRDIYFIRSLGIITFTRPERCKPDVLPEFFEPVPDPWPKMKDQVFYIYLGEKPLSSVESFIYDEGEICPMSHAGYYKTRAHAEEVLEMIKAKREAWGYTK